MMFRMIRIVFFIAATLAWLAPAVARSEAILHHVHGLAFTPDGKALVIPAHVGLAIYRNGKWTRAPGPAHDFMGFSMGKNAIYSSGHPAPGTPLRNPLGLVKSTDGGISWQQLGLSGEADFHLMAAGYRSNAIYVVNGGQNSRMPQPGLYSTQDDGKSWKHAAAAGLDGQLTSIAAHPTSAATVAVGTMSGAHVSRDHGASFKRIGPKSTVTAVSFGTDGRHLYFATDKGDSVQRVLLDGTQSERLGLPPLGRDFVLYIAQNPAEPAELAIATRQRNVYLSHDGGKAWQQIAREGEGIHVASPKDTGSTRKSAGR